MVYSYFEIGRHIVEHEQKGDSRAEYGKALLKELSAKLTARFGEGWGKSHLHNIKQFYLTYSFKQTGFSKQCLERTNSARPIHNRMRLSILSSSGATTLPLSASKMQLPTTLNFLSKSIINFLTCLPHAYLHDKLFTEKSLLKERIIVK